MTTTKDFYFVVVGTQDENGFIHFQIDPYTEEARFPDGSVWNDTTEEWEQFSDNETDGNVITVALSEALTNFNPI